MIVNRACSQGIWDPKEAPPVSASIKLDADNLGLGKNVIISDIANKRIFNNITHQWEGVSKATRAHAKKDGTFRYTITLKAGEGRLLKFEKAPDK
jgi:hypothetical protein